MCDKQCENPQLPFPHRALYFFHVLHSNCRFVESVRVDDVVLYGCNDAFNKIGPHCYFVVEYG